MLIQKIIHLISVGSYEIVSFAYYRSEHEIVVKCHYEPHKVLQPTRTLYCCLQLIDVEKKKTLSERFYFKFQGDKTEVSPASIFNIFGHDPKNVCMALFIGKDLQLLSHNRKSVYSLFKRPHHIVFEEYQKWSCWHPISLEEIKKRGIITFMEKDCSRTDHGRFSLEVSKLDWKQQKLGNQTFRTHEYAIIDKAPRFQFVHFLIIRPMYADLSGIRLPKGLKNRNVLVKVRIMSEEHEAIPCIVNKYTQQLEKKAYCSIAFGEKPKWADDIKAILPLKITPKHHIMLNLYFLEPKAKPKRVLTDSTTNYSFKNKHFIGNAMILLQDVMKVPEMISQALLYKSLDASYLSYMEEQEHYNSKNIVKVTTRVVSSLNTQFSNIACFFNAAEALINERVRASDTTIINEINNLHSIADHPHLWMILSMLLSCIAYTSEKEPPFSTPKVKEDERFSYAPMFIPERPSFGKEFRISLWRAIMRILQEIEDKNPKLLHAYSEYIFADVHPVGNALCFSLTKIWTEVMSLSKEYFRVSAFLLDIILKSYVILVNRVSESGTH